MLKIEPNLITDRLGKIIAKIHPVSGAIIYVNFDRHEAADLSKAIAHFAAHGVFCPEPEKPIEWTEVIPGKVWVHGQWVLAFRPLVKQYRWSLSNVQTGYSDNYEETHYARDHAEARIREERKKGAGS